MSVTVLRSVGAYWPRPLAHKPMTRAVQRIACTLLAGRKLELRTREGVLRVGKHAEGYACTIAGILCVEAVGDDGMATKAELDWSPFEAARQFVELAGIDRALACWRRDIDAVNASRAAADARARGARLGRLVVTAERGEA